MRDGVLCGGVEMLDESLTDQSYLGIREANGYLGGGGGDFYELRLDPKPFVRHGESPNKQTVSRDFPALSRVSNTFGFSLNACALLP
jgi:hypothetical protein